MAKQSEFDLSSRSFTPEQLRAIAALNGGGEEESPGLISQVVDTAGAIVTGAPIVARGAGLGLRSLVQGFDPNDADAMAAREAFNRDFAAYQQKYEGAGAIPEAFAEAAGSSGQSLVGTGASLLGMAGGAALGLPGMAAGAFAAGGATAAKMDYAEASAQLYDEVVRRIGRKPTDAEWEGILNEMQPQLLKHAAIEGVGEGVGDVLLGAAFKPLAPLAKAAGGALGGSVAGKVARGAGRLAGGIAGEVVTETGQQWGQGQVEADMLGGEAPTLGEAFKQVAGPTAAQTVMTGGLIGGARLGLGMLRGRQTPTDEATVPGGEEPTTPKNSPDNPFGEEAYEYQNPFTDAVGSRELSTQRVDVVEGELVEEEPAREREAQAGWRTAGTGLPLGREQQRIESVPGSVAAQASRELGRYGWREGDAMVRVVGFAGDDLVLDVERDGVHTQEYRPRNDAFTPRQASTPMPQQSPEVDVLAPVPVREAAPAPAAPVQPQPGLGLSLMRQPAPVQPMAATGDNMAPVAEAERPAEKQVQKSQRRGKSALGASFGEFDVETEDAGTVHVRVHAVSGKDDTVVLIMEGPQYNNIIEYKKSVLEREGGAEGLARYILEPLGVVSGGQQATTPIPQPAPVQEAPGMLRGMPLDQRIVIGGVKPWGASDADVRKAEQEVASKRETAEPRRVPLHYKGKTVSTATPPVLDARREEQFDSLVRALRERGGEQDDLAAKQFEWQRDEVGFAYDELLQELYEEVNPERATFEKFVVRAREVKDEYEGERLLMEYQKAPGWTPDNAEQLSELMVQTIKSRKEPETTPVSTENSTEMPVENKSKSKPKAAKKEPEKRASKEDLEHLFGEEFGTVDSPRVDKMAEHFKTQLSTGRAYKTIGEARQEIAARMRVKQKDLMKIVKTIDEAVELGVVRAARAIVRSGKQPLEIYRELVDLYKRQPNLGVRTSTSVAEQAYSTPVPLAYLADVLAGVDESTRVYEPTAGNGALLLTASPENAVVNELNHDRAERLRSQGFTVTEEDASTRQLDSDVDAVVANPPFGTVMQEDGSKRRFRFRDLETTEIDQAIVLNAMDELAKDGRAVLIIGGKQGGEKARSAKYNTASQRAFWNTMFQNFNVVDHFTVSGDLYSRQGAKYPIDFVVIDGHTPTKDPVFPAARVPRVYESFEALEEKFDEVFAERAGERPDAVDSRRAEEDRGRAGRVEPRSQRSVGSSGRSDEGRGESGGSREAAAGRVDSQSERRGNVDAGGVQSGRHSVQSEGERSAQPSVRGRDLSDESADAERSGAGRGGRGRADDVVVDNQRSDAGRGGLDVERPALPETPKAKKAAPKPKETSTQSAYKSSSDGFQLGTLVPKNMEAPVQDALRRVKDHYRDVDAFVTRELGYDSVDDMHKAFAAEQVDALALALDNMGRGKGFILGDQTGIGKGRVCAGIIRWAQKNGRTPVFVTMLPDLYADMMRDLNDIGVQDFHPFITNRDISGSKALIAPDGSALAAPKKRDYDAAVQYIMKNKSLPDGYDAVFTSYSQLQLMKNKPNERQDMLNALSGNVVLVLDEAHNAGGSESSIGKFFRGYTENLAYGVLYSSATYAKRSDVMSLYNTTDLSMLGNKDAIEEIMRSGGLPMQQVVSSMLTEAGQYVRREKSFEGADMTTTEAPVSEKLADGIASCMDAVMKFSVEMEPVVAAMDKVLKAQGKVATGNQGTGGAGASSTTFGAVMHNLVAQSTLAIKAAPTVRAVKAAVERGEKPIITLSNTMGSFIEEYVKANGLKAGDGVRLSFADLFKNYLEKTREVIVRPPNAKKDEKERVRVSDGNLTPGARAAYRNALKLIDDLDLREIPISPIDYLIEELKKEGVVASEITGRTAAIDYSGDEPAYRVREASVAAKQAASRGFNGGNIDCLIINRSGSTGISLHASEKFADQKRRTMFILQPDLNIDVFMQTLGRVFRTGQVVPPKYEFILSNMPSERRPAAVLGKKMASLNANTTASAKGTQSFDNIPDFLNVYGDQAAYEILTEDRALDARLGYILKDSDDYDGLVAKLTGRIPLLSMAEQADVYDRLQSVYQGIVDMATATGTNVLDVKAKPLDAKILRRAEFTPQESTESPFGEASEICECDVKVLGKPFTSAEVKKHIEEGKAAAVPMEELAKRKSAYEKERLKKLETDEAKEHEREKLEEQFQRVTDAMYGYPVGTRVRLNSTTGSYVGVVVNYMFDAKKKGSNPVAPSSWRAVVDIADAKRRIAIPMSKLVLGDGNIDEGRVLMNYTYDGASEADFYRRFDEGQSESREKRYIVMGNIPAGFRAMSLFSDMASQGGVRMGRGEIITFDMHDGRRVMGLVLPKGFDAEQMMSDRPVEFHTAAQAETFLSGGINRVVRSSDNMVRITRTGRSDLFYITVPSTKKDGGTYFLDKKLIQAIGEEFLKRQSRMEATFDESRMKPVLNYLYGRGVKMEATMDKDAAREITGQAVKMEAMASLRPSFAANTPHAALRLTPETRDRMNRVVGKAKAGTIRGENAADAIARARAWAKANINNPVIRTVERGKVIFDESGIKDSLSHKPLYQNKLDSVPVIKNILEDGAYLGSFEDFGGNDIINHYWGGRARFADGDHMVFVRVREAKGREQRFYLHDVFSDELIKKATPLTREEMELLDQAGNIGNKTGRPGRSIEGVTPDSQRRTLPSGVVLEARILRTIMEVNGQSRATVKDVVDKLNGAAAGAAPVNVVQSFDELPEHLKENFKDRAGELEGVYDEGTVWMVADNIASADRAAEVWMHEQVGHGGFEALMPEKDKYQLLNRLFAMMGGKGSKALRDVAAEYGFDLGERKGQHAALREHLARLAEKDKLEGEERSRFGRVWKHIADTLKKLFYRLTGQQVKLAEAEIRDLLAAMKARVREGGPDGPKGGTYASLAKEKAERVTADPTSFTAEFKKAFGNLSAQAGKDIGIFEQMFAQPFALAKKSKLIRALLETQRRREDARRQAFNGAMDGMADFQNMRKEAPTAYKYTRDIIHALDGNKDVKLANDKFERDEQGNEIGLNDEHYAELRDWLMNHRNEKTHGDMQAWSRAVEAYLTIRRGLDRDQLAILERGRELGQPKGKLDAMRRSMGDMPFYFPHMRFGDWYLKVTDKNTGDTVYRVHYEAMGKTKAAATAAKLKMQLMKDFPESDYTFENGAVQGMPDEVFADSLSTVNLEQVLMQALGRLEKDKGWDKDSLWEVRDAMYDQILSVLRSPGFGQHMMKRKGVAGYETDDIYKSIAAYKSGLYGWLTKMDASLAFGEDLALFAANEDVKEQPRTYAYARNYVQDMLRNTDRIDRAVSRIRTFLFIQYLAGNIKTAIVNATQNFTVGIPVLGAELGMGSGYVELVKGAQKAMGDWASGRKVGEGSDGLTSDEAAFLDDFHGAGEAQSALFNELMGLQDSTLEGGMRRLVDWLGKPMHWAERFNRTSLALAAYRAAKAGKVKNAKTLSTYGERAGEGWGEANARKFAREVVDDSHFVYGKMNRPEFLRHSSAGRAFGAAYTFRTFTHSMLSWYYRMLRGDKGAAGRLAVLHNIWNTAVIGGVTAIPMYATVGTVLRQLFGHDPDDDVEEAAKLLGLEDKLDVLMYGLPSLGGVYVGGSMNMELPVVSKLKGNQSWWDQMMTGVFEGALGVAYSSVKKVGNVIKYVQTDQYGRAAEEALPTFIANPFKAYRLATTGNYTASGRPIGDGGKISTAEAVGQAAGFQPLSRAKSWHEKSVQDDLKERKSDVQSKLVTRYVMAGRDKNWKAQAQVVKEWKEWNKENPDLQIKPLPKLAKARNRAVK